MTTTTKTKTFKFTDGTRPFHTHTCEDVENAIAHSWECNSAYCSDVLRNCPEHGGRPPIYLGEEPWRK